MDIESFNESDNIAVVNSSFLEYYPSMVLNGRDCLVAYERQNEGKPYIYLQRSDNYGQNWTDEQKLTLKEGSDEISVNSPNLCIDPTGKEAYGVFLSSFVDTGIIGNLIIPDISEFAHISYFIFNFTYLTGSYWYFSDPNIVHHYLPNSPWITCFIGTTDYNDTSGDYSCENSLMFYYQNASKPNEVWLQWDQTLENCYNLSLASDKESKKFFGICEKKNGSNQDLLFFKGTYEQANPNVDPYLDLEYIEISNGINHQHPKISIKDDYIYVVTKIDTGGISDDIKIYYSSDEGVHWDDIDPTGNITHPPGEFIPKFPLISANFTDIVCTYIEDNDLYLTKSKNLGLNWSDPLKINNVNSSVVDKYRYADMPDNQHIVWTDNRNGNYDLYSISQGAPKLNLMIVPGSLELVATKNPYFSTNNSIKFKVKNTGEDYAEDVLIEISINRTGQNPYTTKYPGFIKYLKTDAEIELQQPLFEMTLKGYVYAVSDLSDMDFITVEIIPSSAFQDSDPSDNIEIKLAAFENIFPLLSQRPILITLFKLLALVL
jgi:hypothetical protein